MRYNKIVTKKLPDGKLVRRTNIFLAIPKRDDDIYIITQESDRLDLLASQFYNDSSLWWIIAHANNMISADVGVEPGIQLRIPLDKNLVLTQIA